jgi:hypothetical protein
MILHQSPGGYLLEDRQVHMTCAKSASVGLGDEIKFRVAFQRTDKKDGFRSNFGRHRRWQPCSFFLWFVSLLDVKVKVRRNKLRFLIVGAIVLLGPIHVIFC